VYVALMVVAVIIAGTGFALVIEGFRRRPRPNLTKGSGPLQSSVADEAEVWLRPR
jgi:hypothetical protein